MLKALMQKLMLLVWLWGAFCHSCRFQRMSGGHIECCSAKVRGGWVNRAPITPPPVQPCPGPGESASQRHVGNLRGETMPAIDALPLTAYICGLGSRKFLCGERRAVVKSGTRLCLDSWELLCRERATGRQLRSRKIHFWSVLFRKP